MAEKCIRQLPAIRVTEATETALMRLAARDDRTLSEYVRMIMERHCFGHGASVMRGGDSVQEERALQRSADDLGGPGR